MRGPGDLVRLFRRADTGAAAGEPDLDQHVHGAVDGAGGARRGRDPGDGVDVAEHVGGGVDAPT